MFPIDPVGGVMITASFALLFGAASVHKLRALDRFAEVLQAYAVLPSRLNRPMSRIIPLLELLIAIKLLGSLTCGWASLIGSVLLAIYAAAIALNLRRGRWELDCGCVGFGRPSRISPALVWRNAALALALLAAGSVPWGTRTFSWIDALTVAGGVCVAALLYGALDGLLELSRRLPRRERT